ncbi:NAD(P)H-hydrate dehydratase [Citricoccus sp. K5]|uniref:NAD(P)H-hydrate dehydratase n=1 Tax=Citricoccus sp. K5 TaxID=2653135 RepID=UPI0012F12E9C|nr:NAD(P)H-hydrate dehydratase [Citricoccus sp. K5]VXA97098.1 ADP-dependent (S)-NAD(P)H-hydrate dehydratase / NAD(P)H-hydrate epimerase [Citricoccus sp. K5]
MNTAYTGTAVRAAEKPLLDAGQGEALMRRAAWGLAAWVVRELRSRGPVAGSTVAALVGTGNNGGDALWALSFLRRRGVDAVAVPTGGRMHEVGLDAFRRAGGRVADRIPDNAAILIDGALGTGARGGWEPPRVPKGVAVVACDLPSGVDADTGEVAGGVIPADLTVTFGTLKTGLVAGAGAHAAGRVEVVDIGLEPYLGEPDVSSLERDDALAVFAPPAWDDHKYRRGVLGVCAGSEQYPGAAVLVCSSALASGLGMVQYAGPQRAADLVLTAHPEVVAGSGVEGKAQAWVAGPGLGSDDEAQSRLAEVVQACVDGGLPLVLDASALGLATLDQLSRLRSAGCEVVLTPHQGELVKLVDRLVPDIADGFADLAKADPVAAARRTAEALAVVVLLKGSTTVSAAPDGRALVQNEGGAELATAGTGDCLAGLVGSALARSRPGGPGATVEKAAAAAWLHGTAGSKAASDGPFGASSMAGAVRRALTGR